MKAQDFLAWVDATGLDEAKKVCEVLDCSRNSAQSWFVAARNGEDVAIKKTVALAMTAVYHRLSPWDERER